MSQYSEYSCRKPATVDLIRALFPDRTSSDDVEWVYRVIYDVDHYEGNSSIYFIQAESVNLIKVGRSINTDRRLVQLRLLSPVNLRIIGSVPGGPSEEVLIHSGLDYLRSHGEWFHATPMLRRFIGLLSARNAAQ